MSGSQSRSISSGVSHGIHTHREKSIEREGADVPDNRVLHFGVEAVFNIERFLASRQGTTSVVPKQPTRRRGFSR
jgi:hypothetical protein